MEMRSRQKLVVAVLGLGAAGAIAAAIMVLERPFREEWHLRRLKSNDTATRIESWLELRAMGSRHLGDPEVIRLMEDLRGPSVCIDPPDPTPPIDAVVQAVKTEDGLAVLSAGRNQKVEVGFEFTVYRGDRFVGKVKVIKVWDDLAGARILYTQDDEMVRIGDKAATHI